MWPNPQEAADLVTFSEEILNGKPLFCAVMVAFKKSLFSRHSIKNRSEITLVLSNCHCDLRHFHQYYEEWSEVLVTE